VTRTMFVPLNRPTNEPAPRITGLALVSFLLLVVLMPVATSMAIGEWSPRGMDDWLDRTNWLTILSMLLGIPPIMGFRSWQSYWSICWLWFGSLILIVAYPICLVFAAAVPLGWRAIGVPEEMFLARYALGMLIFCLPWFWSLFQLLTTRYFQPWTTPDQWEAGTYDVPAWVMAITRFWYPEAAKELDRKRAEYERRKHGKKSSTAKQPATAGRSVVARILVGLLFVFLVLRLVSLLAH